MKKIFTSTLLLSIIISLMVSCSKSKDDKSPSTGETGDQYGAINVFSNKQLNGQETGSTLCFFATDSGRIFATIETSASIQLQRRVDIVYFYRGANMTSIGSPDDTATINAHTGFTSLPNWTSKNSTKFYKTAISANAFANATNDSLIKSVDTLSITSGNVFNLSVDDVVAFKTKNGKYGLLCVKAISGNLPSTRSITIDCKVQK